MIIAQRLRGAPDPVVLNPRSRTAGGQWEPTAEYLRQTTNSMNTPNLEVRRLRGLGEIGGMPDWAPWAIGGLALGLVGGFAVYKFRKKKR